MPHIDFSESADLRDAVKLSVIACNSVFFFIVCVGKTRLAMYVQRFRATVVAMENNSIAYSECVFAAI
jgi:hypothetical protein